MVTALLTCAAMIRLLLLFTLAASHAACIYTRANVSQNRNGAYSDYPSSVENDRERRASRRKWALIASPLEILGGVGLAALALYAPATHMDDGDESVTDNLGDAGKEIAGRLVLAGVGGALVASGVGDAVLGLTDPLRPSPYVRDGSLVAADHVDGLAPLSGPRVDLHIANSLGTHGVGGGAGLGLAHWIHDSVRLRHSVSGEFRRGFGDRGLEGGVTFDVNAQLAFGRRMGGLLPKKAVGLYAGSGVWWTAMGPAPIASGGVSLDLAFGQYRLGTTYVPGVDRLPSINFDLRLEIGGD